MSNPLSRVGDFGWPAGKCLVGVHGRADGPLQYADEYAVRTAGVESVKLMSTARPGDVDLLRAIRADMFILVRLFADFRDRDVRAYEFVSWLEDDLRNFYNRGVRYFEIHNEPNLQIEGWQRSWQDGRDYGRWHLEVMGRLRAKFPGALFGFPGLSPGPGITGQRSEIWTFLLAADEAVRFSDWVGVHCYWLSDAEMAQAGGGRVYEEYRRKYPDKLLFITEFSNPGPWVDAPTRGQQYVRYYNALRAVPGIGAAFAFVLSASANFPHEVWRREDGSLTEIPGIVGARNPDPLPEGESEDPMAVLSDILTKLKKDTPLALVETLTGLSVRDANGAWLRTLPAGSRNFLYSERITYPWLYGDNRVLINPEGTENIWDAQPPSPSAPSLRYE